MTMINIWKHPIVLQHIIIIIVKTTMYQTSRSASSIGSRLQLLSNQWLHQLAAGCSC